MGSGLAPSATVCPERRKLRQTPLARRHAQPAKQLPAQPGYQFRIKSSRTATTPLSLCRRAASTNPKGRTPVPGVPLLHGQTCFTRIRCVTDDDFIAKRTRFGCHAAATAATNPTTKPRISAFVTFFTTGVADTPRFGPQGPRGRRHRLKARRRCAPPEARPRLRFPDRREMRRATSPPVRRRAR
jgi:hypothetical protein